MSKNKDEQMDSRVGRLEGVVEALVNSVRSMTDSLGSFKDDILNKLGKASEPKWPLLATLTTIILTLFGLCVAIVTILLSGQGEAIQQNRIAIEQGKQTSITKAYNEGIMTERIRQLENIQHRKNGEI